MPNCCHFKGLILTCCLSMIVHCKNWIWNVLQLYIACGTTLQLLRNNGIYDGSKLGLHEIKHKHEISLIKKQRKECNTEGKKRGRDTWYSKYDYECK